METNEVFPARETNPADFTKRKGYNPKIAKTSCTEVARPDQRAARQMRPAHFTNQTHLRGTWGGLFSDLYVTCSKLASATGDAFARGLLMVHFSKLQIAKANPAHPTKFRKKNLITAERFTKPGKIN